MLKKKENSLYNVRGRKLQGVYFAFETIFAGYLDFCGCPTKTSRAGMFAGSSSPRPPLSRGALRNGFILRKLGKRSLEPLVDTGSSPFEEWGRPRPRSRRRGASSSAKLLELPCETLRSASSWPSRRASRSSSDAPRRDFDASRPHARVLPPALKFLSAMPDLWPLRFPAPSKDDRPLR